MTDLVCKFCGERIVSFNRHRKRCGNCAVAFPFKPSGSGGLPFNRKELIKKFKGGVA